MAHEYYFNHHLVEARRNRFRLLVVVSVIVLAAIVYLVPSLVLLATGSTATPTPTPKPEYKPVSTPQLAVTTMAPTPVPPAPVPGDVTAPTVPGNFQALVAGDNSLVTLSWTASTDAAAVKSYRLERSLDQINWTMIADGRTTLDFRDDTVAFAIHYYYRLRATDTSGNVSGYAFADGRTGEFAANSTGSNAATFVSDDRIASVDLPSGASNETASCAMVTVSAPIGTNGRSLVAGPYTLVCKYATGALVREFNKPVIWSYVLKTKLKGFENPGAVSSEGSSATHVEGAVYDSKTQTLRFNQTAATTTAAVASAKQGVPANTVAVGITLVVIIGGVFLMILRKTQMQDYNEYLRKKYYDL